MSVECQRCSTQSQLYLCSRCQSELRDTLTQLAHRTATNCITGEQRPTAGWLELLEDAALGHTRLGESARRSTEHSTPLPVHLGASRLLESVKDTLHGWAQKILIQGGC